MELHDRAVVGHTKRLAADEFRVLVLKGGPCEVDRRDR
jgi:hypothetical protein